MATQHLYALVKTSGAVGPEEGGLESDVVGIYGSRALAEKAIRLSTRGYKTIDGVKYHHGSNSTVTTFLIHKRVADELPPGDDDEDERDQVSSPGSFSELARHIETFCQVLERQSSAASRKEAAVRAEMRAEIRLRLREILLQYEDNRFESDGSGSSAEQGLRSLLRGRMSKCDDLDTTPAGIGERARLGKADQLASSQLRLRIAAIVVFFFSFIFCNAMSSAVAGHITPKMDPLPDIMHRALPTRWATEFFGPYFLRVLPDLCTFIPIILMLTMMFTHRQRWTIIRRFFVTFAIVNSLRSFTINMTLLPDMSDHCRAQFECLDESLELTCDTPSSCRNFDVCGGLLPYNGTYKLEPIFPRVLFRMFKVAVGQPTCGDLVFSGHTIYLVFAAEMYSEYGHSGWLRNQALGSAIAHAVQWMVVAGLLLILLLRFHYTIDCVVAVCVVKHIWYIYHVHADVLVSKCFSKHRRQRANWSFPPLAVVEWLEGHASNADGRLNAFSSASDLRYVFEAYDYNQDGTLDKDEAADLCEYLGLSASARAELPAQCNFHTLHKVVSKSLPVRRSFEQAIASHSLSIA